MSIEALMHARPEHKTSVTRVFVPASASEKWLFFFCVGGEEGMSGDTDLFFDKSQLDSRKKIFAILELLFLLL